MPRPELPSSKIVRETMHLEPQEALAKLSEGGFEWDLEYLQDQRARIRSRLQRAERKQTASSGSRPRAGTFYEFVVALPADLPPNEVIKLGRGSGFKCTEAAVRKARQTYAHLLQNGSKRKKAHVLTKRTSAKKPAGKSAAVKANQGNGKSGANLQESATVAIIRPAGSDPMLASFEAARREITAVVMKHGTASVESVLADFRQLTLSLQHPR